MNMVRGRTSLSKSLEKAIWLFGKKAPGRTCKTYFGPLAEDHGCQTEDLPTLINDRIRWREEWMNAELARPDNERFWLYSLYETNTVSYHISIRLIFSLLNFRSRDKMNRHRSKFILYGCCCCLFVVCVCVLQASWKASRQDWARCSM